LEPWCEGFDLDLIQYYAMMRNGQLLNDNVASFFPETLQFGFNTNDFTQE